MENENTELKTVEETATPVQIVQLDIEQYNMLCSEMLDIRSEIQVNTDMLHSVWFLLALLVLFEAKRVINGISQRMQKVRKK